MKFPMLEKIGRTRRQRLLQQQRPPVLCMRETPFNRIHLGNMQYAAESGATIFPIIPTFYNKPIDSQEMARQFVFRVLAQIGLDQDEAYRWKAGKKK